jgi:hypothetical protein
MNANKEPKIPPQSRRAREVNGKKAPSKEFGVQRREKVCVGRIESDWAFLIVRVLSGVQLRLAFRSSFAVSFFYG